MRWLAATIAFATLGTGETLGQARQPDTILLQSVVFDPLQDGVPDFDAAVPTGPPLRNVADPYRLVQFEGKVTSAVQRELAQRGIGVVGYVPHRALIVRLPAQAPEALTAVPGLRFVSRFVAGYKLSPSLRDALAQPVMLSVDVFLFPDEDPTPVADAIRTKIEGVRIEFVGGRFTPRITLELPRTILRQAVGSLLQDPAVQFVSRRFPLELHNDNSVWIGQSYDRANGPSEANAPDPKPYALSATIWNHGLTGEGQIVAVGDAGLEHEMCFFFDPAHPVVLQTVAPPGALVLQPEHRKLLAVNAPMASSHTTDDPFRHGTHTTGSVAGDDGAHAAAGATTGHDHGDGMAPGAKIVFEDLSGSVGGSCFTSIVVSSFEALLEQEYEAGARISSNSWGSSGGYEGAGLDADATGWEREDLLVVFSAGNSGGGGVHGFSTCKNCLAVGAAENFNAVFSDVFGGLDPENMAAFSSRGPTSDGRIKPDVVAPGFRVSSPRFPVSYVADEDDPACDPGDPDVCFPSFGGCYITDSLASCHADELHGTSMATPVTAGLAALARQYFVEGFHPSGAANAADSRNPSAAFLKAVMINGARNMTGRLYERRGTPVDFGPLADAPSNVQGWGRVLLDDVLYFSGESRRLEGYDVFTAQGLATGQTIKTHLFVTSPAEPLKLTLVWTDAPGQPAAMGALIDDLDLELTAPDGRIFRGNQWTADNLQLPGDVQSQANPPGRDSTNNIEGILIPAPQTGLYTVRVVGQDVPGAAGVFQQGAALVATGAVARCTQVSPPAGVVVQDFASGTITLDWDPVPGAIGYTVLRNGTSCGDPLAADMTFSVPAGVTQLTDSSVQPHTVYNYTVRAVISPAGCETVDSSCVSAITVDADAPPPVPDGSIGAPLRVAKGPTPLRLTLEWDALTCPADGYHLLYGPLGAVGDYEIAGSRCGLGLAGTFQWVGVPATDTWFLVVAESAGVVEGSWGERSDGSRRGEGEVSGQCGMLVRDESGTCP